MVFAIAVPMTLAYSSVPLLGIVDTGVVGQLNDPAMLGGLAVGAILFDLIFSTFNFLRASTTGLVAQAMGAGDEEQQRIIFIRSLLLAVICGLILLALSPLILQFSLFVMDVPENVATATATYFTIRVLAAPFTLINYSVLGWLLGQARANTGLLVQTFLNGVNIALSLSLGLWLGWGLEGVAWATVVGEFLTVVLGLAIFFRSSRGQGPINWVRVRNPEAIKRLLAVNSDIMVRSFCLLFAFAFFTAQGGKFGETTLAANAVLMNFFMIAGYFLDGFATAAEQLVGRSLGARYRPSFDRSVRLTILWGYTLAAMLTLVFLIAGPWLIDILTVNEMVRGEARHYLAWAAISAIVGVLAFQMDGVFIGATWSREMRNMMLLSLAIFIVAWYVLTPAFGNHGLWAALQIFFGVRGISLYWRLRDKADGAFPPPISL